MTTAARLHARTARGSVSAGAVAPDLLPCPPPHAPADAVQELVHAAAVRRLAGARRAKDHLRPHRHAGGRAVHPGKSPTMVAACTDGLVVVENTWVESVYQAFFMTIYFVLSFVCGRPIIVLWLNTRKLTLPTNR